MFVLMTFSVFFGFLILALLVRFRTELDRRRLLRALSVSVVWLLLSPIFMLRYGIVESLFLFGAIIVMALAFWRFDYLDRP